jgi:hypothetical protein
MSDTTEADWQARVEYIAATLGTAISAARHHPEEATP